MLIVNEDEYSRAMSLVKQVVCPGLVLPDKVFKKEFASYVFVEDCYAMAPEFYSALIAVMKLAGDRSAVSLMLAPDPISAVKDVEGYYPCLRFTSQSDPLAISAELHREGRSKFLTVIADIFEQHAVVGESLSWSVFVDRVFEVAVIAVNDSRLIDRFCHSVNSVFPVLGIDQVVSDILVNSLRGTGAQAAKDVFLRNYS